MDEAPFLMIRKPFLFAGLLAVGLGFLFLRTDFGQTLLGRWSFVRSVSDTGSYFRLKVKVAYKGEKQDFDIVVGCNVHSIRYKDGSDTYEAGLIPTVYGRRMSDGKGLVVRPPDACRGQTTANGRVPAEFMPLMIVYDDADKLGFGTAYLSDEAYASPLSLLTFGGATIESATREEWDAFRRDGPQNIVTREQYHSIQSDYVVAKMGLKKVWPPFGMICYAYRRFLIPEAARAKIREFWPHDHPQYWMPTNYEQSRTIGEAISKIERRPRDWGEPSLIARSQFSTNAEIPAKGVALREGGGLIDPKSELKVFASAFFAADSDISADKFATSDDGASALDRPTVQIVTSQIRLLHNQGQGFGHCYASSGFFLRPDKQPADKERLVALVDEQSIRGSPRSWVNPVTSVERFLERDEYYFSGISFGLDSVRGDI
ncbi:MAG: hypothetical protein J0H63_02020 [Rhizobiales bacterium]|nr:hypothetical protein [Hyphomicrobiales bacterium]MBN9008947.1 hypothetical protein [Hyphomicrobiales bacterium]